MSATNTTEEPASALYKKLVAAKQEMKRLQMLVDEQRRQDIIAIVKEALAVGFRVPDVKHGLAKSELYYGIDSSNDFSIKTPGGQHLVTVYHGDFPEWYRCGSWKWSDGGYPRITSDQLQKMRLTPLQVEFMNWSCVWTTEIYKYWTGKTDFADIQAFIEHLKANPKGIYHLPA